MPHHKSASKRLKTAAKSRQRNVGVKSVVRKQLKAQRAAAAGAEAQALLPETHAALDKAAQKGVIPKRRAARLKSRTAREAAE